METHTALNYPQELASIKNLLQAGSYRAVIKECGTVLEVALRSLYQALWAQTHPEKHDKLRQIEAEICEPGRDVHTLGLGLLIKLITRAQVFERLGHKTGKDYRAAQKTKLTDIVNVELRNSATHRGEHPPEAKAAMTYYALLQFLEDAHLMGLSESELSERRQRYHYSLLRHWSKGYLNAEDRQNLAHLATELELSENEQSQLEQQAQSESAFAIQAWQQQQVAPFEPPVIQPLPEQHNLPSVLAHQIQQGLADYLSATFPITTPHFHGILERFVHAPGQLFKGPYLSIKLPFEQGQSNANVFDFNLGFAPYLHQENAFLRLTGKPNSTLIATGTGSGKTECFLMPILQHCLQHKGESGIKAILIYPMNALATDQARRIAKTIHHIPELKKAKLTAGIFIGDQSAQPSSSMLPDQIITDRQTLKIAPPDILLTNYKMLDLMLTRPEDYPIWKDNRPDTLQFLVVDEIHTFDGAQGTDLACLIRRLKSRLHTPAGHLCCVGTSATLGGDSQKQLLEYAKKVFGEPFESGALIQEERQSLGDFLGDQPFLPYQPISANYLDALNPEKHANFAEYIQTQYKLWFGQDLPLGELDWRVQLSIDLKSHLFFQNLMRVLQNQILSESQIIEALGRYFKELKTAPMDYQQLLLNSMIALISCARSPQGEQSERLLPFLHVRTQFWVREMNRLVASVSAEQPKLNSARDLKPENTAHLPLVHCRDCGSLAWGSLRNAQEHFLQTSPESFYSHFFSTNKDICLVFPQSEANLFKHSPKESLETHLCSSCLAFGENPARIRHRGDCKQAQTLPVILAFPFLEDNPNRLKNCQICGGDNSLSILGHRATTLTSVMLGQVFSSRYSDDKKVIAFSDSVQDASHRAGFFTARNYNLSFRMALQQYVAHVDSGTALSAIQQGFSAYYLNQMGPVAFVGTFLPSELSWLHDYESLLKTGKIPHGSGDKDLVKIVKERCDWEVYREYTYRTLVGRTLEKSLSSMVSLAPNKLDAVIDKLLPTLENEIHPLRNQLQAADLRYFLLGLIKQLKQKGCVFHPAVAPIFLEGKPYGLFMSKKTDKQYAQRKPIWISRKHQHGGPRPLSEKNSQLEALKLQNKLSWYAWWVEKNFLKQDPSLRIHSHDLLLYCLKALTEAGILHFWPTHSSNSVWALNPDCLSLEKELFKLRCETCHHEIACPTSESEQWLNQKCLRKPCENGIYLPVPLNQGDYYKQVYARSQPIRIMAHEHTGLLKREDRERVEQDFMSDKASHQAEPWLTNLLSCTPTLEMGIDIGDLSTVVLCSVPPSQSNYLQRIGRSGRQDGNSLNITLAASKPHDLYYFAEPLEMMAGAVQTPGIFLDAAAVLERQLTAYCFDQWVESGLSPQAFPRDLGAALRNLDPNRLRAEAFPHSFFGFIKERQAELCEGFIALFEGQLSPHSNEHLLRFIQGDSDIEGSLSYKILDGLNRVKRESEEFARDIRRLGESLKTLEKNPAMDDTLLKEITEIQRERDGLQSILKDLRKKNIFHFLTDEGLLPNYAFPEEGVLLRSVIYRKKKGTDAKGFETFSYEYSRPASNAISELAPNNHFYAEGRKVQIDQVKLSLSREGEMGVGNSQPCIEKWRFCTDCSYMQRESEGQSHVGNCPKCKSIHFRESGQVQKLVRLRQVYANTADDSSRSGDDSDQRVPLFFDKHKLVNFDPSDILVAYQVKEGLDFPFGFEFIRRVQLREINFGSLENDLGSSANLSIQGKKIGGKGFLLCKTCGKVQENKVLSDPSRIRHAYTCSERKKEDIQNLVESLFLYREYQSEALRILMPPDPQFESKACIQSFIAALHLGLKIYFSGNIDHLSTTLYHEPIPDSEIEKTYLVLYDNVPGGTGYLKQLVQGIEPLQHLFQAAMDKLRACPCQNEAEKDGCYSCILAYSQSYEMENISRKVAMELLSKLLKYSQDWEQTDNISRISANAILDSHLERLFVQALKKLKTDKPELQTQLRKEIVDQGYTGYRFDIGACKYEIIPQKYLDHHITPFPCKPDFIFKEITGKLSRPIAVFTDGYQYHQDIIGKDLAKRMALVQSGKFWVWSLSWKDVESHLKNAAEQKNDYYSDIFAHLNPESWQFAQGFFKQKGLPGSLFQQTRENAMTAFIRFLSAPFESDWQNLALSLCLGFVPELKQDSASARQAQSFWMQTLVNHCPADLFQILGQGSESQFYCQVQPLSQPVLGLIKLPKESLNRGPSTQNLQWWILNDLKLHETGFQSLWNGFLRAYAFFQFLPQSWFMTQTGLEQGLYDPLFERLLHIPEANVLPQDWQEVQTICLPELAEHFVLFHEKGLSLPEAGFELTDHQGRILAQAELAFEPEKIALLTESELSLAQHFIAAGWQIWPLDDAYFQDPMPTLAAKQEKRR